jgi:hypothetical protein
LDKFIARFRSLITGTLSGFDRLVFRGHLLPLMRDGGMFFFLEAAGIRLLDFKDFVRDTTERLKETSLAEANALGRAVRYQHGQRPRIGAKSGHRSNGRGEEKERESQFQLRFESGGGSVHRKKG